MSKITILLPSLVGHGMERMAVLAAEALSEKHTTEIVIFTEKDKFYNTNVPIKSLDLPFKNSKIGKVLQLIKRSISFKRYTRQYKPDIVLSFGTSANFVNVLSKKLGGNYNSIISYRGYATIKKSIGFNLSNIGADGIICISEEMNHELLNIQPKLKGKTFVIHNAIDEKKITTMANESTDGFIPKTPAFVSIGRLEPVKGFKHLINAFAILLKSYPDSTLTIIGDGSEKQNIITQLETLGITESVFLLGSQINPFKYIKKCDICVQTSITEGFMNVIVEAGICGKAVISTACKVGPKEILMGDFTSYDERTSKLRIVKNGILVPAFISNESEEHEKEIILAEAMKLLCENIDLRNTLSENMNLRSKEFNVSKYKSKLENLVGQYL